MLKEFHDMAPKAAVAAVILWGGGNYLLIAPEVATRIVKADHLGLCEANYKAWTMKAAEERLAAVPPPAIDLDKEMAAQQIDKIMNDPLWGRVIEMGGLGMPDLKVMREAYERQKKAAVSAYQNTIKTIRADTATELGKSGSTCGCIADIAIADTRTDWTMFSATLGMIRPASIKQFDQRMERVAASGQCTGKAVR